MAKKKAKSDNPPQSSEPTPEGPYGPFEQPQGDQWTPEEWLSHSFMMDGWRKEGNARRQCVHYFETITKREFSFERLCEYLSAKHSMSTDDLLSLNAVKVVALLKHDAEGPPRGLPGCKPKEVTPQREKFVLAERKAGTTWNALMLDYKVRFPDDAAVTENAMKLAFRRAKKRLKGGSK